MRLCKIRMEMRSMKTIKQIADELGIDKQRVYRYIRKNHINEAHQKNGVMYYDEVAESSIKRAFLQKEPHQASASSDTVIDVLVKQSEMLKMELEIKNKQIEELNERLAESQKLLNQQQQLTALLEHKLQLLIEQKDEESAVTEEPKKNQWWKFWK